MRPVPGVSVEPAHRRSHTADAGRSGTAEERGNAMRTAVKGVGVVIRHRVPTESLVEARGTVGEELAGMEALSGM